MQCPDFILVAITLLLDGQCCERKLVISCFSFHISIKLKFHIIFKRVDLLQDLLYLTDSCLIERFKLIRNIVSVKHLILVPVVKMLLFCTPKLKKIVSIQSNLLNISIRFFVHLNPIIFKLSFQSISLILFLLCTVCVNFIYQRNGLNIDITLNSDILRARTITDYKSLKFCTNIPGCYFSSACINVLELNKFPRYGILKCNSFITESYIFIFIINVFFKFESKIDHCLSSNGYFL